LRALRRPSSEAGSQACGPCLRRLDVRRCPPPGSLRVFEFRNPKPCSKGCCTSSRRRGLSGICANPLFRPQCPLARLSGRQHKRRLGFCPRAIGDAIGRRWPEEIRKVEKNFPFGETPDRMFGWRRSWEGPRSALSRSTGKGRRRDDRYGGFVGRIHRRADF
jgi:hypothetical protein